MRWEVLQSIFKNIGSLYIIVNFPLRFYRRAKYVCGACFPRGASALPCRPFDRGVSPACMYRDVSYLFGHLRLLLYLCVCCAFDQFDHSFGPFRHGLASRLACLCKRVCDKCGRGSACYSAGGPRLAHFLTSRDGLSPASHLMLGADAYYIGLLPAFFRPGWSGLFDVVAWIGVSVSPFCACSERAGDQ